MIKSALTANLSGRKQLEQLNQLNHQPFQVRIWSVSREKLLHWKLETFRAQISGQDISLIDYCFVASNSTHLYGLVHESSPSFRRPQMRIFFCAGHLNVQHFSPSFVELIVDRIDYQMSQVRIVLWICCVELRWRKAGSNMRM